MAVKKTALCNSSTEAVRERSFVFSIFTLIPFARLHFAYKTLFPRLPFSMLVIASPVKLGLSYQPLKDQPDFVSSVSVNVSECCVYFFSLK